MANKAQSNIDLNYKQLLNLVLQKLSVQPTNPTEGQVYYDTTKHSLMIFNGTEWIKSNKVNISDIPDLSSLYLSVNLLGVEGGVAPLGTDGKVNNDYLNIDSSLSLNSENTVQNKIVTSALNEKVNSSSLATVATTGDYNDLINKPAGSTFWATYNVTTFSEVQTAFQSNLQILCSFTDTTYFYVAPLACYNSGTNQFIFVVTEGVVQYYITLSNDDIWTYSVNILENTSKKGSANGYCPLGADTKVPEQYLPDQALRNIGEIVTSTIPLTDAGLHLLDGTLISGSGSYADFVDYIAELYDSGDYTSIFETEANWQTSVTNYGVCGKFVYTAASGNDPATVRLPKIAGFTEGTIDQTVLGNLTEAGLPNITGKGIVKGGTGDAISGAFYITGVNEQETNGNRGQYAVGFDASLSNPIYGNSLTVQPQSVKVLYYIVVATTTKTAIQVDIDEIATDLNGKADTDLTNVSNTSGFRKLVEVYNNGASWYKVFSEYNPTTGNYIGQWCEQGGQLYYGSTGTGFYSFYYLKPFISEPNVLITVKGSSSTTSGYIMHVINAQTSTSTYFTTYLDANVPYKNWRACGYIS